MHGAPTPGATAGTASAAGVDRAGSVPVGRSEIADLPAVDSGTVHPAQIDANRHMNVREYFALLTDATIASLGEFHLDPPHLIERRTGLFSVDHHARYLRELTLGDAYTVHVRLIDVTEKAIHAMAYLVQSSSGRVSSTLESLLLNVDLETRHVAPFAPDVRELLRDGLARSRALGPVPQGCGAIRARGGSLA